LPNCLPSPKPTPKLDRLPNRLPATKTLHKDFAQRLCTKTLPKHATKAFDDVSSNAFAKRFVFVFAGIK